LTRLENTGPLALPEIGLGRTLSTESTEGFTADTEIDLSKSNQNRVLIAVALLLLVSGIVYALIDGTEPPKNMMPKHHEKAGVSQPSANGGKPARQLKNGVPREATEQARKEREDEPPKAAKQDPKLFANAKTYFFSGKEWSAEEIRAELFKPTAEGKDVGLSAMQILKKACADLEDRECRQMALMKIRDATKKEKRKTRKVAKAGARNNRKKKKKKKQKADDTEALFEGLMAE
jgi:hypothetical protein